MTKNSSPVNDDALLQLLQALAEGQSSSLERLEAVNARLESLEDLAQRSVQDAQKRHSYLVETIGKAVADAHTDQQALLHEMKARSEGLHKALSLFSSGEGTAEDAVEETTKAVKLPLSVRLASKICAIRSNYHAWQHRRAVRKLEKLEKEQNELREKVVNG